MRAPLAGLVAGLRLASHEVVVALPVDCPLVTPEILKELVAACEDAAVPQTGPLPGAYRRTALPLLARRLRNGELTLRDALVSLQVRVVHLDPGVLANVNSPEDLQALQTQARARQSSPAGAVTH